MLAPDVITRLWDHGWLLRHQLQFERCDSADDLVRTYVASPQFGTSFLPSEKDESSLHGPFVRARISASDFQHIDISSPHAWVAEVSQLPERGHLSEEQRTALRAALADACATGGVPYRLRFTEADKELQHDWGSVIWVFREFLFAEPSSGRLTRYVIGFD